MACAGHALSSRLPSPWRRREKCEHGTAACTCAIAAPVPEGRTAPTLPVDFQAAGDRRGADVSATAAKAGPPRPVQEDDPVAAEVERASDGELRPPVGKTVRDGPAVYDPPQAP